MNSTMERGLQDQLLALEQDTANEELFRLAQARNNALQQKRKKPHRIVWPVLATSLGSVLSIAVLFMPAGSIFSPQTEISSDDYYSELPEDNFELYDDLEFYDWLADIDI